MAKFEADPSKRDEAAQEPAARTSETRRDDIPPIHVLEAADRQERKDAEDLLAGFDRPGRGLSQPDVRRDFVDYYAGKPPKKNPPRTASLNAPTVVTPRKKKRAFPWLIAGGGLVLIVVACLVAYVGTRDLSPTMTTTTAARTTTAATATAVPIATPPARGAAVARSPASARDEIPPPAAPLPEPAVQTTAEAVVPPPTMPPPATAARASARPDPRPPAPRGAPSAAERREAPKPPPRDDFIRDLTIP
jgi:hypothetical protein